MKSILTIIFSFLLVVSGLAQTRNVVVGTNDVIVSPTNFWSANASNGRTGLGLSGVATSSIIPIVSGGTGATNAGGARTNLGLGATWLTNTNVANFRTAVGLGINDTIYAYEFRADFAPSDAVSVQGSGIQFLGTAAATTRTNLELGATWLTNTTISNFRTAIGLGTTNNVEFNELRLGGSSQMSIVGSAGNISFYDGIDLEIVLQIPSDTDPVVINSQWNDANVRSNLGLGTSDNVRFNFLTITNSTNNTVAKFQGVYGTPLEVLTADEDFIAGYGSSNYAIGVDATGFKVKYSSSQNDWGAPVLVSTGGTVVSPTNFWQVAPIQTLVQDFTGITVSQTNNATNARNVYVYSLATNVSGISNTIILPTNTSTFNGDEITVVHKGTTNTTTVVRQAGSTNNLITLNRFDESVKFIRELGQWDFYHNISFVEPIQFSGTNTSANVAASRTNLGLGATWLTNTSVTNFQKEIFYTNTAPSNIGGNLGTIAAWIEIVASNGVTYKIPAYTNVP